MRGHVLMLGVALAVIWPLLTCDVATISGRVFTPPPPFVRVDQHDMIRECRRRTPVSWACADAIISQSLR